MTGMTEQTERRENGRHPMPKADPFSIGLGGTDERQRSASSAGQAKRRGRLRWPATGSWRTTLYRKAAIIEYDCRLQTGLSPHDVYLRESIECNLREARAQARRGYGLIYWASGHCIESAWTKVHTAEEELILLKAPNKLLEECDEQFAHVADLIPEHTAIARVRKYQYSPDSDLIKGAMVSLLRAYHEAEDRLHRDARVLRNLMVTMSVFAMLLSFGLLTFLWQTEVPVIKPPQELLQTRQSEIALAVMIAGVLGACVSSIPSLSRTQSSRCWYRLTPYQAMLKIALGPLFATVGIMLVLGGLSDAGITNTASLLAMAVVFGAGQEAVSRFADKRAEELTGSLDRPRTTSPASH